MNRTIKQTHFEALPVGEYQANIGAAALEEGQFGTQVKFRFDLTTAGFEDRSVTGWASATFSPKSKLFRWAAAAFGRDIPADYDLNLDHLLDRPVTLVLVTKTGDDGREFNKIHEVKPARRNGYPATAPGAAVAGAAVVRAQQSLTAPTAGPVVVNAAAPTAGPVRVNTATAGPSEVPEWLDDDGGVPF